MNRATSIWDRDLGYVELAGLLDRRECDEIVAECRQLFSDEASAHPRDKPHSGTRHLEELDRRIPSVADVVHRPAVVALVADMTGREGLRPVQVSLRSPQPGYGGQDLHRDAADTVQGERATVVTAIMALVDFTENNGATRLVPGSHLTNEPAERYKGRRSSPDEIVLTGPAGTAFVFSGHLLHSGTENRSGDARPALQVLWRC